MLGSEIKSTLILAWVFASRMLGLFMIYPVLSLYTNALPGATPALIGLAMGIYGLSQALFQLPFGWLSDHFGRKPIVLIGLALFAVGSLIAAISDSITGIILGRAIQGMGAIGSPILAWVADGTREGVRTRAMALIGVTIGMTFTLSLMLGPFLDSRVGLSGLFGVTVLLAILAMVLIVAFTKTTTRTRNVLEPAWFRRVLGNRTLWGVFSNIFVLHALLSATFLVLPEKIKHITDLQANVWKFYFPVLGLSLFIVAPLLRYAEESIRQYRLMKYAMLLLAMTTVGFLSATNQWWLGLSVTLFFVAFNFMEASLPSMVSRMAPTDGRGTALGIYSCAQFLGLFAGGAIGGLLDGSWGEIGIGSFLVSLAIVGWGALQSASFSREQIFQAR